MDEPIHGSAPDLAGRGLANPFGTILSAALLLRHSLGLEQETRAIESAVDQAITAGHLTVDLADANPLTTISACTALRRLLFTKLTGL